MFLKILRIPEVYISLILLLLASPFIINAGLKLQAILHENKYIEAQKEMHKAKSALTIIWADAGVDTLQELIIHPEFTDFETTVKEHTELCYDLMKNGRDATSRKLSGRKKKLRWSYVDLNLDPWGNPYQFFCGTLKDLESMDITQLVSYRYLYRTGDTELYFASDNKVGVFIFSLGGNGKSEQGKTTLGQGDDMGTWGRGYP